MNFRTLVFSIAGICLTGYTGLASAMDDMEQQQAMAMTMIRNMPKDKVREFAAAQFASDVQVIEAARANNVRWLVVESALAALLVDGFSESTSKKVAVGLLSLLGLNELRGVLGTTKALWDISAKQEDFYRHLMSIRAGADMRKQALEEVDEEDFE